MRDFGLSKTAALLRDATDAIHAAARSPRPERVHKMRVAIRRLQQAVRLFRQFLREKGVKSVRAELRSVMDAAGALRNFDIACSLVRRAGGDAAPLRERRIAARAALQATIAAVAQADIYERWTRELGMSDGKKRQNTEVVEGETNPS
jgi:triphosphatase